MANGSPHKRKARSKTTTTDVHLGSGNVFADLGVPYPEQSLVRARQSLDQQLAAGDSARRRAEEEMMRLRAEVGKAQAGGEGSRAVLDSLRRALKTADFPMPQHSSTVTPVDRFGGCRAKVGWRGASETRPRRSCGRRA